jgi:hypothetical protein
MQQIKLKAIKANDNDDKSSSAAVAKTVENVVVGTS